MSQKSKTFLVKLIAIVTLFFCALGTWFSLPSAAVKADTVEIKDTLTVEYWSSSSGATDSYFVIKAQGDYTIVDGSLCTYWNDHTEKAALNNGCDLMEYILIDGQSARSIVTKNATDRTYGKEGDSFPFNMSGVYAPIAVETAGAGSSGLYVRVLSDYKSEFVITVKAGFTLKLASGHTVVASEDVSYKFADKTLTKVVYVPEVDKVDATNKLGFENRTGWSPVDNPDHLYFAITYTDGTNGWLNVPEGDLTGYWNDHPEKAEKNYGVDIMEYLYINDKSVREIIIANKNGETSYKGITFPFSVGSWYAPVTVEPTKTSGLFFRVMNDYVSDLGGSFKLIIKAGFTITDEFGKVIYVKDDIVYKYDGANLEKVQEYALSFEGLEYSKTVSANKPIGELPETPTKDGYVGVWSIDGAAINADMVYTYNANKTAVVEYTLMEYIITIVRANGAEETVVFTIEDRESKLTEVTLTADDEEYTYSWVEVLPEMLELKDYTFTEVATRKAERSKIVSQSLSIGETFAMNVYVGVVGETVPSMQVSFDGNVETVNGLPVGESLNKYVYRVENISAYQLASTFSLILFEDEEEVDSMTSSVEEYLVALSQKEISADLKTLIADIVAYGQAAEEMAGVESGIYTIDGLTATEYADLYTTDYKKSSSLQNGVEITTVYVSGVEANHLTIRFAAKETPIVKINGNVVSFVEVEEGSGIYEAHTDAVALIGCGDRFKVTLSVGETVVQTLIYSVKSYVYEKQNSNNETEKNYAKALYNCSVSLQRYGEGV